MKPCVDGHWSAWAADDTPANCWVTESRSCTSGPSVCSSITVGLPAVIAGRSPGLGMTDLRRFRSYLPRPSRHLRCAKPVENEACDDVARRDAEPRLDDLARPADWQAVDVCEDRRCWERVSAPPCLRAALEPSLRDRRFERRPRVENDVAGAADDRAHQHDLGGSLGERHQSLLSPAHRAGSPVGLTTGPVSDMDRPCIGGGTSYGGSPFARRLPGSHVVVGPSRARRILRIFAHRPHVALSRPAA